jgi:hypothetical protein
MMPCISSCPACHRDITLADHADSRRRLRCPLCQAEFLAEAALADSVAFPPMAIEVALGDSAPNDAPPDVAPRIDSDVEIEETVPHENLASEQPQEASPVYQVRSVPRAKKTAFGFVGQLLGMALGGVLGLALGYYILLWIGGPQADFLQVRAKLPQWMLPTKRPGRQRPEARRRAVQAGAPGRSLGDLLNDSDEGADESPDGGDPSTRPATSAKPAASADEGPVHRQVSYDSAPGVGADPIPSPRGEERPHDEAPAVVGPRGFSVYSADDLAFNLAKAGAALGCEHCHSTGYVPRPGPAPVQPGQDRSPEPRRVRCEHCKGKPAPGLTAEAFDRLCDLADAVTFAQLDLDDAHRDRLRMQVQAALLRVGQDQGKTQIVGRLAGARLENSQRLSNGVILAGTVQDLAAEGPLFRIQLVLFGVPKSVVVYSSQPPQPSLALHDRVLILGSIVDSPRQNLAGYSGELTQAVWGGLSLKLAP